jgi:hypothetical protein
MGPGSFPCGYADFSPPRGRARATEVARPRDADESGVPEACDRSCACGWRTQEACVVCNMIASQNSKFRSPDVRRSFRTAAPAERRRKGPFVLRVIRCLAPSGVRDRSRWAGGLQRDRRVTAAGGRRRISLEGGNRGRLARGRAGARRYGDLNRALGRQQRVGARSGRWHGL